ncbi:3-phenylpropionate MFS transporter [Pelagibius marinus]|uniref:3-phenylpropionate MFS transporter n=1 Tax=Pelagibius marinus TaxID=2762760 RepID=UPI001872F481|nr:3-phenylpropionate MFS transporter [Pelagibius marinus]
MSPQALSLRFALYYGAVFLTVGCYLPFWPLWLESRGLSAGQIGLLLALAAWVKVAATPALAHLSDRAGWGKGTIVLLAGISLLAFAAFVPATGFAWILAVQVVVAASFPLLVPLGESQTMAAVYRYSLDYGRIRLWGSLAFIAGSLAAGRLLGAFSADWVLWLILAALVLTFAAAVALPGRLHSGAATEPAEDDRSLRRLLSLLRRPGLLVFLLAAALIQASHAAYYGFSSLHWRASGIGETTIALLWTEGVVIEILFFAVSGRLTRRFSPAALLIAAGLLGGLRWAVTAATTDLALLAAVQTLHAATFAVTHLAAMHYITRTTPAALSASMQSFYSALSGGLAMGGAMLLAGRLYEAAPGFAFLGMAAVALAASGCALAAGRLGRPASEAA